MLGWRRLRAGLVLALAAGSLLAVGTGVAGAAPFLTPAWTTYHDNAARTGFDPDSSHPVPPKSVWTSPALDGGVYGQPLVLGHTVFVATENNSVYALVAKTGKVLWHRNAGAPVPGSALPCGDIDPVGITGTPVLDPSTGAIYAVADVDNGGQIRHELVAYRIADGTPLFSPMDVDVGGGTNPEFVPANQLQRAALALDGKEIVIGFGGNDGDCAHYHGWAVGVSDTGAGPLHSYQVGPNSDNGGAVWGGGGGPPVDSAGNLYITTGNGFSDTTYDHGDSIIKLSPTLAELDHYAPSTWASDNDADLDLGSDNAMLLPSGLLFQSGKNGTGYLVRSATGQMGGTGVAGQPDPSVFNAPICSPGSWGGPAFNNSWIYVPCGDPGGGGGSLVALTYTGSKSTFTRRWSGPDGATSPPIVAGGLVWVVSLGTNTLYGLGLTTGNVAFSAPLSGPEHFTSPSAGGGRLFVADGNVIDAFQIAQLPKPVVTISSPSNGATETTNQVKVTGTVSDTVDVGKVTVNGIQAKLGSGTWKVNVPLRSGSNTITATANDGAGVSGSASVSVTFTG